MHQVLRIVTKPESHDLEIINDILTENDFVIDNFNLSKTKSNDIIEIKFESADPKKMAKLIEQLRQFKSVNEVIWEH